MKKITFIILTTLLISCNNEVLDTYTMQGLNGKVESYLETKYKVVGVSVKEGKDEYTYDTLSVSNVFFNKNGKIEKTIQQHLYENDFITVLENIYDEDNKIIKQIEKQGSTTYEIKYFHKGNRRIKKTIFNTIDSVFINDNTKYTYNRNDRLIKIEKIFNTLDSITKDTLFFNSRVILYNPNGLRNEYHTILIDKNRNVNYENVLEYSYNNKNLEKEIRQYDEKGKLNNTQTFEYNFDDKGSWVKKKEYRNGEFKSKIIRVITYYHI